MAGPTGPAGPEGPAGDNGADGVDGATGAAGTPGEVIVVSAEAQYGLDLAPVALALDGLSGAELEQIGRGSYLVNAVMSCTDCHNSGFDSAAKYLAGGQTFSLAGGTIVVHPGNLTPDPATGLTLTKDEFIELMRTGRDFKQPGKSLVVMPWADYRWTSTADLEAVYAYLEVIPAESNVVTAAVKPTAAPVAFPASYTDGEVTRPLPDESQPDQGYMRRGLAIAPLDYTSYFDGLSIEEQVLFGKGAYLVQIGVCTVCHTNAPRLTNPGVDNSNPVINVSKYLKGGRIFATPAPPLPPPSGANQLFTRAMTQNLIGDTHGAAANSFPYFYDFLTSLTWDDARPVAWRMPAYLIRTFELDDLIAVWTYLNILQQLDPDRATNDKFTQRSARYCTGDGNCDTGAGETCNVATHECVGKSCSVDGECEACQTCTGSVCTAPITGAACLTTGL